MNVSFDFDSTVARFVMDPSGIKRCIGPDPDAVRLMRAHHEAGDTIHIITSRKEKREKHLPTLHPVTGEIVRPRLLQFLRDHGLIGMVSSINFTNDQLKGHSAVMFNLGIEIHYDDREEELMALPPEILGVPAWEMKTVSSLEQLTGVPCEPVISEARRSDRTKVRGLLEGKTRQLISEARLKGFRRAMRQVYHNLPEFVFDDMFGHEKQWSNVMDPDIGADLQKLTNDVLMGKSGAIEAFRQFERERPGGSVWLDTSWSKKPQSLQLRWSDLSDSKRQFFEDKYIGRMPYFPARTKDRKGFLDKMERVLDQMQAQEEGANEPVLLLRRRGENGYDVIGGNNRTFNAFFVTVVRAFKDDFNAKDVMESFVTVFDYLAREDPSIRINAYVGSET